MKTQTYIVPDNSLMLHNIVRKYGKESFWFVSSPRAGSWAPVSVPENILEASRSVSSASSSGSNTPNKLSEAVSATSTISIQGKVVQFRPPSTLQFEITANDKLDDPDFSDDNPDQATEAFLAKGVISAHTYACCPKKTCRNKKLAEQKCPNCHESVDDNNTEYYCIADVVIQRQDKKFLTKNLFKPDLEKIVQLPPFKNLLPDPKLRDHLTACLPVNAQGIFANGGITIISAKRTSDRLQ